MNWISKMFAAILAVLLLYAFPASEAAERQDDISAIVVHNSVMNFVDSVRSKGYITPVMYSEFVQMISSTGNTFDIELEHLHKKYDPVYTDPADPGTFQNEFAVNYDGFYTPQMMEILFPDLGWAKDDERRKYKLTVGDFFTVKVKNTNRTNASILRDFLNGTNTGDPARIVVNYGGMVLNEDY